MMPKRAARKPCGMEKVENGRRYFISKRCFFGSAPQ
jgi:hypothetical protein